MTNSSMTVHNDAPDSVTIDTPNSGAMSDNFPHESINPDQSDTHDVKASWWNPSQSWFETTFDGAHMIHTNLGSGQNSTDSHPQYFDDGKVAVMIAPVVITPIASRFDLDFFVGPGTIPPLVNGFIQANLPAIIDHINVKHIERTWASGLSVGLSNIGINPTDLLCAYAGVSNVTSSSTDANVLMRLNNKASFTGSFSFHGQPLTHLTGSLTNLAIMVNIHANIGSNPKTVEVKSLKVSLDDYSIPVDFWTLLAFVAPWLAITLKAASVNANTIAMTINTIANAKIIEAINKAIKDHIPTLNTVLAESFAATETTSVSSGH